MQVEVRPETLANMQANRLSLMEKAKAIRHQIIQSAGRRLSEAAITELRSSLEATEQKIAAINRQMNDYKDISR